MNKKYKDIMANKGRLQFLHHKEIFSSREEAVTWLNDLVNTAHTIFSAFGETLDAEPIAVKYKDANQNTHVILAIGREGERGEKKSGTTYHYIDSAKLEEADAELFDKINSAWTQIKRNEVKSDDKTIVVTPNINGTDIKANIDNTTITKYVDGVMSTALKIKSITPTSANVKEEYILVDINENNISGSESIKIYKDSSLSRVYIGHIDDKIDEISGHTIYDGTGDTALCLVYLLNTGKYSLVTINIEAFIHEAEFKDGLEVINHKVYVKIDNTSEAFLTVSPAGVRLNGVASAIDTEKIRATSAETVLNAAITTEVSERNAAIATETARAKGEETTLATAIANEVTLRDAAIQIETNRATAAETTLQTNINNEVVARDAAIQIETQRAEAAENGLTTTINSTKTELEGKITQEVTDRNAAIQVEKGRAEGIEAQLRADLTAEASARDAAISAETANRKAADDVLSAAVQTLSSATDTMKTNLYADNSNPDSIKHIILTDTLIAASAAGTVPSVDASLLRQIDGKIYASKDSKDMLYKGANLETTIDGLVASSSTSSTELQALSAKTIQLETNLAAAEAKITTLEGQLSAFSATVKTFIDQIEDKVMEIMASNLLGTDKEIKITNTIATDKHLKIGFADDAVFGPIML